MCPEVGCLFRLILKKSSRLNREVKVKVMMGGGTRAEGGGRQLYLCSIVVCTSKTHNSQNLVGSCQAVQETKGLSSCLRLPVSHDARMLGYTCSMAG